MKILLIEDDAAQAEEVRRLLSGRLPASVQVISTESEFRANLDVIRADPPDIAIVDVMLRWADASPRMPEPPGDVTAEGFRRAGLRVQRSLSGHASTRDVPVVLYTALDPSDLRDELSQCSGTVACLSKSSDPMRLVRLIRSLLAVSPSQAALLDQPHSGAVCDPTHVFISYSHRDRQWLDELKISLSPFVRNEEFQIWDDTMIDAGDRWRDEIRASLDRASVAILLVSRYFFASDFIAQNELPPILRAAEENGVTVLWIAVSASSYAHSPIGSYQSINDPSRPLDSLAASDLNREFVSIAERVRQAIARRRVNPSR